MMKLFGLTFQRASLFIFLSLLSPSLFATPDSFFTHTVEQSGVFFTETLKIHFNEQHDNIDYENLMDEIGYTSPPYSQINHIKKLNNDVIYDTHYTIGAFGFRKITEDLLNKKASHHLIIAGDSNTFSEGCSDKDSLAAQLSPFLKDFDIYNLGQRGAGPHNMLALMQNYPFENLIKEQNGIFIYNFFPSYMFERVIGSKNYTSWDQGRSPYYDLDENENLVRVGHFKDRKFISAAYRFISSHSWLNNLLPNFPRINDHHIEIVVKVLLEMKKEYLLKFPNGKFIIAINNSYQQPTHLTLSLLKRLERNRFEIIEIPYNPDIDKTYTFKDAHLNGNGQEMQSRFIAQKLGPYLQQAQHLKL